MVIRAPALPRFDPSRIGYFGVDVGGTLCKIAFYEPKETAQDGDANDKPRVRALIDFVRTSTTYGTTGRRDADLCIQGPHGRFHFILFETRRMERAVEMIVANKLEIPRPLSMTGGGAHKFTRLFTEGENGNGDVAVSEGTFPRASEAPSSEPSKSSERTKVPRHHNATGLGLGHHSIRKLDEMRCLVEGLNFVLRLVEDECFAYELTAAELRHPSIPAKLHPKRRYINMQKHTSYPYMLVNIGTGVSILKVEADGTFQRISGSGLGGGTYWGLARLLTGARSFDESLRLTQEGSSKNVDMTVGDIYGGDYGSLSLDADMTASFFGKFVTKASSTDSKDSTTNAQTTDADIRAGVSDADICNGLMLMVTNNIGQIAYLLAQLHHIDNIFFSGTFLRHSSDPDGVAALALSKAIAFWSGGKKDALFLRHEGYFGALGAFLTGESAVDVGADRRADGKMTQ